MRTRLTFFEVKLKPRQVLKTIYLATLLCFYWFSLFNRSSTIIPPFSPTNPFDVPVLVAQLNNSYCLLKYRLICTALN